MLRVAAKQGDDLMRTQKTMPVNEPYDVTVTLRESHWSNRGSAFEAGKAYFFHSVTMTGMGEIRETAELAICGK